MAVYQNPEFQEDQRNSKKNFIKEISISITDLKRAILQSIFNFNKFNLSILNTNYEILAKIYTKCKHTLENVACFFGVKCCHASLQCRGFFI